MRLSCATAKSVRSIVRSPYQAAIDWALSQLSSSTGQEIVKERQTTAEWVVAAGKNFHGLRRAQHRGTDKVSVQVLMTAAVQNLKRLLRQPLYDAATRLDRLFRLILSSVSPAAIPS